MAPRVDDFVDESIDTLQLFLCDFGILNIVAKPTCVEITYSRSIWLYLENTWRVFLQAATTLWDRRYTVVGPDSLDGESRMVSRVNFGPVGLWSWAYAPPH